MTSLEPMMKLVQAKADVLILLGEAKERFMKPPQRRRRRYQKSRDNG